MEDPIGVLWYNKEVARCLCTYPAMSINSNGTLRPNKAARYCIVRGAFFLLGRNEEYIYMKQVPGGTLGSREVKKDGTLNINAIIKHWNLPILYKVRGAPLEGDKDKSLYRFRYVPKRGRPAMTSKQNR